MLNRITLLEREMSKLRAPRRGIGDNNPPERIEQISFGENDWRAVEAACAILKTQQPTQSAPPAEAVQAVKILWSVVHKLRPVGAYVGKQAGIFVSEALKAAGAEVGKRAIQSPFWLTLITKIAAVADAASSWLNSLGSPF